jgi:glycerol-3-phosphate dehydrogenase
LPTAWWWVIVASVSTIASIAARFASAQRLASAGRASGLDDAELLSPGAKGVPVTLAEPVFGVTHEGAHDAGDLLDRRTRIGLVPADRAKSEEAVDRALALAKATIR